MDLVVPADQRWDGATEPMHGEYQVKLCGVMLAALRHLKQLQQLYASFKPSQACDPIASNKPEILSQ
jgi:hypothetical protein